VSTLRAAGQLLTNATDLDALAPIAAAAGCDGSPQPLDADAMRALDSARAQYPRDRDVLLGLALLGREAGDTAAARRYVRMLLDAHPQDAQGRALLQSLGSHR